MPDFLRAPLRVVVIVFAFALLGAADPSGDGKYFVGTWSCAGVTWTFAPLIADDQWIRDVYGDPQHPDGSAVFGYVAGLHAWIYRDFHADGSYADLTSPGLVNGRWEWTGPYYPSSGGPALNGRVTYVVVNPTRYDRIFEALRDGALVKAGGDSCTKSS